MIYLAILAGLHLISFGMTAAKHGEPKEGNESAWTSLVSILLVWFLVYKGVTTMCP